MSIYGPRIRLPSFSFPKLNLKIPRLGPKAIIIFILLILVIATTIFFTYNPIILNNHLTINWKNNPLNISTNQTLGAELNLIILNNQDEKQDIELIVTSESTEIIIVCPDAFFPNVAPNHQRKTTCLVRRNPNEKIFAGTYQININTNLGSTSTTLEIRR
jgi:hypothetical protein